MEEKYNPSEIEPKWQKAWEEAGFYKAVDFDKRSKRYILIEFPYPSGERLHVGHGRSYTALDAMARKLRMQGFNVLYPIGWDAFGLPAENYAIKTGVNPAVTTKENIAHAKAQAKRWGLSFDWDREVNTTDPKYYKWTQWIFLKLYEKDLAYQAEVAVNWCPFCKTNLADEEVLADGTHERCGNQTERRTQKQWLLKITSYADRLLEDLKTVNFLAKIRIQQENWIGKSEGITIDYPLVGSDKVISCYSTRPDTNFGTTFIVVAPEHPQLKELVTSENGKTVSEYAIISKKTSEVDRVNLKKEKTGVFTGSYAVNRINGRKLPIWVSDFAILTSGTGMVVGVPAHDQRDWEFAKKYGLEIVPVIKPKGDQNWNYEKAPYLDIDEAEVFNSDFLNGMPALDAKERIIKYLIEKGWGKRATNFHLRDWVFSRQHYWGEPIPMIHCPKCGVVPVPEDQLPVELPYVEKYQPSGTGESPLAQMTDWVNTTCPKCKGPAERETDTMPNWAGSNWYFMRYCDPQNDKQLGAPEKLKYWLPVDLYNGGMEHTTLHLLYSRFIYKFLYDIGVAPTSEPYARRTSHGVVLGPNGEKMSKSRGNVVNPDDVIKTFGADTFRLYESFMGPFDQMIVWSDEGVEGCYRFLKRVWHLSLTMASTMHTSAYLLRCLHRVIKKVGEDIDNMKFNTAVAAMMEFINVWQDDKDGLAKEDQKKFLIILAPLAPFIAEELWSRLGETTSIHQQSWPEYDKGLLEEEDVIVVVQVNGKVRGQLKVQSSKCKVQSEIEILAKKEPRVLKYLEGKEIRKVIFVPGKLMNFVI